MKNLETTRTHDKLYINEDRKDNPKESFKFIRSNVRSNLKGLNILDIGCATGDFLFYLNEHNPHANLYGADIDLELINQAKLNVPSVKDFYQIDISQSIINIGKFDIIFMIGVHSIFDDLNWITSIKKLFKDNYSKAYIFGIFNSDDLDVIIKSRSSNSNDKWESGWNVFSKTSVKKTLFNEGLEGKFKDWNIDIDIEKNIKDPLRSWTIDKKDKTKMIINGLCLIHNFSLLEINKI